MKPYLPSLTRDAISTDELMTSNAYCNSLSQNRFEVQFINKASKSDDGKYVSAFVNLVLTLRKASCLNTERSDSFKIAVRANKHAPKVITIHLI